MEFSIGFDSQRITCDFSRHNPSFLKKYVNDPTEIEQVNQRAKTWTAKPNPRFEGKTFEDVSRMLMWTPPSLEGLEVGTPRTDKTEPSSSCQ